MVTNLSEGLNLNVLASVSAWQVTLDTYLSNLATLPSAKVITL